MRTIAFVDTYYPDVLKANPPNDLFTRSAQLAQLCFGTSNFYSEAFKKLRWGAADIVGNDFDAGNNSHYLTEFIVNSPIDVVYCQDLCFFSAQQITRFKAAGKAVVGQISSKWPGDDIIKQFDVLFSSFPHYIPRFNSLGVRGEFLPIAFGEEVLNYVNPANRDIDISFVGGLGSPNNGGYWAQGTDLFEAVAKALPAFQWWGYFIGNLAAYPNLSRAYRGAAWGLDQYRIYARSKIVINRHGEVAEGYTNNMRCFEATGMGACLFTEASKNLSFYFNSLTQCVQYSTQKGLIEKLEYYLDNPHFAADAGYRGQTRTLREHTYTKRLAAIEPILRGLIK